METALKTSMGDKLWYANLKKQDVNLIFKPCSFWTVALKAWCEYNYVACVQAKEINMQYLWLNLHIRQEGKPMCNAGFVQAGVLQVRELFNDNHKLRSYEELQEKHPGCYSWLEYAGLIRALPRQWKKNKV